MAQMRSLYEINNDFIQVLENGFLVDEETGEITFQEDALNDLDLEFSQKVDNIACYIKDIESLNQAIKDEKKALDERLKVNDRKVENLKKYVSSSLKMRDMNKLETARNKITFRKSKSVNVINESLLADEYFTEKITKAVNKTAIKKAIESGLTVDGAEIKENRNVVIK